LDSSWNIGSIGIGGPPLRGPASTRLVSEPPLSPPLSPGASPSPTASAQSLEPAEPAAPAAPVAPAIAPSFGGWPSETRPEPAQSAPTGLESLLIRFRLITSDQLDEAMREKLETGKDVGAIVVERGWVNEDQLARLLSYAPAFGAPQDEAVETAEPQAETEAPEAPAEPAYGWQPEADEAEAAEASAHEPATEPISSAGPVVSTEPEAPESSPPALGAVPSLVYQLPPALELVEPESASEPETPSLDATTVSDPFMPIVEHETPEPASDTAPAEERAEPAPPAQQPEMLAPLAPVQPAAEPVSEPAAAVEAPLVALQPATAPAPELTEPAPAEAAAPQLEPAAPVLAPEPQTVRFVEPAAIETIARVFLRLSTGERVEAGSFDDMGAAKARAAEVVREVSQGERTWPFCAGRYIRPEAIVSVDIDATVVRYS
jgi:hypothetical protein